MYISNDIKTFSIQAGDNLLINSHCPRIHPSILLELQVGPTLWLELLLSLRSIGHWMILAVGTCSYFPIVNVPHLTSIMYKYEKIGYQTTNHTIWSCLCNYKTSGSHVAYKCIVLSQVKTYGDSFLRKKNQRDTHYWIRASNPTLVVHMNYDKRYSGGQMVLIVIGSLKIIVIN